MNKSASSKTNFFPQFHFHPGFSTASVSPSSISEFNVFNNSRGSHSAGLTVNLTFSMGNVISLYFRHFCKFVVVITAQKFDL